MRETKPPLQPGDAVKSYMRPDLSYTVVDRSGALVLVRSGDGSESWIARTMLRRLDEPAPRP